ncbi:hypothetical protein C8Q75DRAFT_742468 [Abortiporus biennis]|nr:hypothetical protein C8Q75DRAFT_742468 [Abortiporus biennis]
MEASLVRGRGQRLSAKHPGRAERLENRKVVKQAWWIICSSSEHGSLPLLMTILIFSNTFEPYDIPK